MTPPPTQVKAVEQPTQKKISFALQMNEKSTKRNWGRKKAKQAHRECNEQMLSVARGIKIKAKTIKKIHQQVEKRQVRRERKADASAVMDSGTTSTVIRPEDAIHVTDTKIPSNKIFTVATGEQARGGNQALLRNGLRGVAAQAELVPTLKHNSLISTSKLADADYHTVFTPTEVLVYDGEVRADKIPVWKGWRDSSTGMWRVPLVNNVWNLNTDTAIMTEEEMKDILKNEIQSVHSLPSKAESVKYLHAALGFPTKHYLQRREQDS